MKKARTVKKAAKGKSLKPRIPMVTGAKRPVRAGRRGKVASLAELPISRLQLQTIFDALPDAIISTDRELNIVSCNQSVKRVLGYSPEELEGKNYQILIPQSLREDAAQQARLDDLLAKGYFEQEDFAFQRKNGEVFPANFSVAMVKDEQGRPQGAVGAIRDITKRKLAELALRESEERYRTLVETSPDAITLTDLEGKVLTLNQKALALYGVSRFEEVIGQNALEYLAPRERPRAATDLQKTLTSLGTQRNEFTLARRDGSSFEGEVYASVLRDEEGKPKGFVAVTRDITERKRAEAALRESEERFRRIFEEGPLGMALSGGDFRFVKANQAFCEMMGYSERELTALTFREITHPEHLRGDEESVKKLRAGEISNYATEKRYLRKDGGITWGAVSISVVRDEAGQFLYFLVMIKNITERKQAEAALRESEEKYRLLVNNIPTVTWQTDRQGWTTFISPNVAKVYGFTPDEIYAGGDSLWFGRIHPEDAERVRRAYVSLFETESEFNIEYRIQRRDGEWIWLQDRALVHDGGGSEEFAYGVFSDITERKRAEQALQESEKRYRTLFDDSPISLWEEDFSRVKAYLDQLRAQGISDLAAYFQEHPEEVIHCATRVRLVDVNKATLALFQAKSQEDLLRGLARTFKQDNYDSFLKQLLSVAEGRDRFDTEMVNLTLTGEKKNVMMHWVVAPGYEATFARVLVSIIDLTERKRLEAQILHAQKLESLGILAGGIAHDFNNLLVSILGHAGLALGRSGKDSPSRKNLEQIEFAARRAADLTRQMLAYSGRGTFEVKPLNLSKLVEEMAHLLEVAISKRVKVAYHFAPELPAIAADATQVRQVVMNLISNASEAIGEADGSITVVTGLMQADRAYLTETYLNEELAAGRYVYLEVSDTGCGLDKETQAKIFDPFFTTKFPGRGLGLASVLGIVRGHRGAIKVYSEVGHGTTFKVLFPSSAEPAEEAAPAEASIEGWRGQGTILVVDDEETVRQATRAMLEEFGFTTLLAADGREGIELFRRRAGEIAAVLLDLTMIGLSGKETLEQMLLINPDIPIILTSGYNELEATRRFAGKGHASFIQKPYQPSELIRKMREALENKKGKTGRED